jgi:hypothetical protein
MVVMTRESLVLRGVSVLCGGESVNPRLGTGYGTPLQAPTVCHPMPHPMSLPASSASSAGWQPRCSAADADDFAAALREDEREGEETGRSHGHAGGATARKSLSTTTRSQIPGTATRRETSPARGLASGKKPKAITPTARLTVTATVTA